MQIHYRALDGSRYVRVLSQRQDVSTDRAEVEREVDVDVIASNAMQQAAAWSSAGNYAKARTKMVVQQRLVARAAPHDAGGYDNFVQNAAQLDDALHAQEATEAPAAANPLYDEAHAAGANPLYQGNDDFAGFTFAPVSEAVSSSRRNARNDDLSQAIYSNKQAKSVWRK